MKMRSLWQNYLLWYWTRCLRLRYKNFKRAADNLDCGHSMARFVSITYLDCFDRVNEAIRKIKALDPEAKLSEMTKDIK